MVKRGEIWLVALDPTVGSEIKNSRPCVIVSPPELNEHLRKVIVAPMTSKGFPAPFRVPVTHAAKKGLIVLDQIRAVDRIRLAKRVGAVNSKTLSSVLTTLQEVFAE
jgi:mRNA interferase MazF